MYERLVHNRRIEISVEHTRKREAEHKKTVEIAKKMIKRGRELNIIAEDNSLTLEYIEELRSMKA